MYKLFRTKQFVKDYNKTKLSDKHYEKFIKFVSLLLEDKKLREYPFNCVNSKI